MSDIQLYDSQTSFQGGMQSGFDPAQVGEHQFYRGVNVTCREGVIDPRPAFNKRKLDTEDLASDTDAYDAAYASYQAALAAITPVEDALIVQQAVEAAEQLDHENASAITNAAITVFEDAVVSAGLDLPAVQKGDLDATLALLVYYNFILLNPDLFTQSVWDDGGGDSPHWINEIGSSASLAEVEAIATHLYTVVIAFLTYTSGDIFWRQYVWVPYSIDYEDGSGYTLHDDGVPYDSTAAITAFADAGGGQVTVTSASHGRSNGDKLFIRGTTNYDGDYTISNIAANTFEIAAVWVVDDAAGNWYFQSAALSDSYNVLDELLAIYPLYATELVEYSEWQDEIPITAAAQVALDDVEAAAVQQKGIFDGTFDAEFIFKFGKFQGCKHYNTRNGNYIAVAFSGHIFLVNLADDYVTCLTNTETQLNEDVDRCYFCQAENFMVIQDGVSSARILEGAEVRITDPDIPEIPTGTKMAYGHGRIAVQVSPRHFKLSDIYLPFEPDNVLKMKETRFYNEGGGFTVSGELGRIITLTFANVSDTSTGDGPLLAICENGFSTFAINNPRRQWLDIGVQKVQLEGTGIVGNEAYCKIHEDILYRSHEGIRSYAVGRREAASAYKYTELSREMERYIQNDIGFEAQFISMVFFGKRMLSTTAPMVVKAKGSRYQIAKVDYDATLATMLLLDPDVTETNIVEKYETQLTWIYDNTGTWTGDNDWINQQIIDIGTAEDPIPYIQKLYDNTATDVDQNQIDKFTALVEYKDAIKAYYDQIHDDTCFKGIISFDFSLAGFTKSTSEDQYRRSTTGSYDGIWTGILPTQIITTILGSKKHCFSFCKHPDGSNSLYEITENVTGYDNYEKKIESILELRSMPFKAEQTYVPAPFIHKKIEEIILWVRNIKDDVDIKIYSSTDVVNSFVEIGTIELKAKTNSVDNPLEVGAPQSRAMLQLKDISDELFDETTQHPQRNGNEFQFRLVWTGMMRLRRFFAAARKIDSPQLETNETEQKTYPIDTFDEYRYSSEI